MGLRRDSGPMGVERATPSSLGTLLVRRPYAIMHDHETMLPRAMINDFVIAKNLLDRINL